MKTLDKNLHLYEMVSTIFFFDLLNIELKLEEKTSQK